MSSEASGATGATPACAGMDPEDFFPDSPRGSRQYEVQAARAKAACACCPVRAGCLDLVLGFEKPDRRYGIWAGLGPADRRRLVRERRSGVETTTVSA